MIKTKNLKIRKFFKFKYFIFFLKIDFRIQMKKFFELQIKKPNPKMNKK